jgi:hypothetical protein
MLAFCATAHWQLSFNRATQIRAIRTEADQTSVRHVRSPKRGIGILRPKAVLHEIDDVGGSRRGRNLLDPSLLFSAGR